MRRLVILLVSACALAIAAPAQPAPHTPETPAALQGVYVGRVADTRAFIALVAGDGKVGLYLCDSRTMAGWVIAPLRGGKATLKLPGAVVAVTLKRGGGAGTVAIGQNEYAFTVERARGNAGLYRSVTTVGDTEYVGGWIVLGDGARRGAVTSGINIYKGPRIRIGVETQTIRTALFGAITVDRVHRPWVGP